MTLLKTNPENKALSQGISLGAALYVSLVECPARNKLFTYLYTAGFMKTVPSVYTISINTIYLSLSTQVAEGAVFRKYTKNSFFKNKHEKNIYI